MKYLKRILGTTGLLAALMTTGVAQAQLQTQVFTAGGAGFHATSTLVFGETDAILIDGQFTLSEAHRLAAEVLESGKNLTKIFITHAHPDHYFGLEVLKAAFPKVQIVAKPSVVAEIQATRLQYVTKWQPMYGANLTKTPLIPEVMTQDFLEVEGERLDLIDMAPGEIENSTVVYIPAIRTLIAGDVVNNGVHVWLAEANADRRVNWLQNLKRLMALDPAVVIPGHKVPELKNTPESIQFTMQYIRDFETALSQSETAEALQEKVLKIYSDLALPIILEIAAKAIIEGNHGH